MNPTESIGDNMHMWPAPRVYDYASLGKLAKISFFRIF